MARSLTLEQLRFDNQALERLPIDPALRRGVSSEPIGRDETDDSARWGCLPACGVTTPRGARARGPALPRCTLTNMRGPHAQVHATSALHTQSMLLAGSGDSCRIPEVGCR